MGTLLLACARACLLIAIASHSFKPPNVTCRMLHRCMYISLTLDAWGYHMPVQTQYCSSFHLLLQDLLHSITVALQHRCSQLAVQLARRWCHIPAAALSQPIAAGSEGRTVSWRSETARCSWSATSPQTSWLIPSCMLRWMA